VPRGARGRRPARAAPDARGASGAAARARALLQGRHARYRRRGRTPPYPSPYRFPYCSLNPLPTPQALDPPASKRPAPCRVQLVRGRDEACPVSTGGRGGGARGPRLRRAARVTRCDAGDAGGGGGARGARRGRRRGRGRWDAAARGVAAGAAARQRGGRRVAARGVSSQYGARDETCPVSTGGGRRVAARGATRGPRCSHGPDCLAADRRALCSAGRAQQ
jgi:hypothetical protein